MANGERHIDKTESKQQGEPSLGGLGGDLLSQPSKAADKVANAPDVPVAPKEQAKVADAAAPTTDSTTTGDRVADAVIANFPKNSIDKYAALNTSPEGQDFLNRKHDSGLSTQEQWKQAYPLACKDVGIA